MRLRCPGKGVVCSSRFNPEIIKFSAQSPCGQTQLVRQRIGNSFGKEPIDKARYSAK